MKNVILLSAIYLGITAAPAMAYLDPVTGSIVLQALIGGVASVMIAVRRVREKILGVLGLRKAPADDAEMTDDATNT